MAAGLTTAQITAGRYRAISTGCPTAAGFRPGLSGRTARKPPGRRACQEEGPREGREAAGQARLLATSR